MSIEFDDFKKLPKTLDSMHFFAKQTRLFSYAFWSPGGLILLSTKTKQNPPPNQGPRNLCHDLFVTTHGSFPPEFDRHSKEL